MDVDFESNGSRDIEVSGIPSFNFRQAFSAGSAAIINFAPGLVPYHGPTSGWVYDEAAVPTARAFHMLSRLSDTNCALIPFAFQNPSDSAHVPFAGAAPLLAVPCNPTEVTFGISLQRWSDGTTGSKTFEIDADGLVYLKPTTDGAATLVGNAIIAQ